MTRQGAFRQSVSRPNNPTLPSPSQGEGEKPPPYEGLGADRVFVPGVKTPVWTTKPAFAGSPFRRSVTRAGGFGSPERHFNAGMSALNLHKEGVGGGFAREGG